MKMIYFRCRNVIAFTLLIVLVGFYIWPKLPPIDMWSYPESVIPFELDGSMAGQGFGRVDSFDSQFNIPKMKNRNEDFQAGDFYDVFYNPGELDKKDEKKVHGEEVEEEVSKEEGEVSEEEVREGDIKEEEKVSGEDVGEGEKADEPTVEAGNAVSSSDIEGSDGKHINSTDIKDNETAGKEQTEKEGVKKSDLEGIPDKENETVHGNVTNPSEVSNSSSAVVKVDEVLESNAIATEQNATGEIIEEGGNLKINEGDEGIAEESGNDNDSPGEELETVHKNGTDASSKVNKNNSDVGDNEDVLESTGADEVEEKKDEDSEKKRVGQEGKAVKSAIDHLGQVDHDGELKTVHKNNQHTPSEGTKNVEEVEELTGIEEDKIKEDETSVKKKADHGLKTKETSDADLGPGGHEGNKTVHKNGTNATSVASKNGLDGAKINVVVESAGTADGTKDKMEEDGIFAGNLDKKQDKNVVGKVDKSGKGDVATDDQNKVKGTVNKENTKEGDSAKHPEETPENQEHVAKGKVEKSDDGEPGAEVHTKERESVQNGDAHAPLIANKNISAGLKDNHTEKYDQSNKVDTKSAKEDTNEIDWDSFIEYTDEETDKVDGDILNQTGNAEEKEEELNSIDNEGNEDPADENEIVAEEEETAGSDEAAGEVHYAKEMYAHGNNISEAKKKAEELDTKNIVEAHKNLIEEFADKRSKNFEKSDKSAETSNHGEDKEEKPVDQNQIEIDEMEDADLDDGGDELKLEVKKSQADVGHKSESAGVKIEKIADVKDDMSHKHKESPKADIVVKYLNDKMLQMKQSANVPKQADPEQAVGSNFGQPVAPEEDVSYN